MGGDGMRHRLEVFFMKGLSSRAHLAQTQSTRTGVIFVAGAKAPRDDLDTGSSSTLAYLYSLKSVNHLHFSFCHAVSCKWQSTLPQVQYLLFFNFFCDHRKVTAGTVWYCTGYDLLYQALRWWPQGQAEIGADGFIVDAPTGRLIRSLRKVIVSGETVIDTIFKCESTHNVSG